MEFRTRAMALKVAVLGFMVLGYIKKNEILFETTTLQNKKVKQACIEQAAAITDGELLCTTTTITSRTVSSLLLNKRLSTNEREL